MLRELKLAEAPSRLATHWHNRLYLWPQVVDKLRDATVSHHTVEQYRALPKSQQADAKDVGGFVGGHLADGRRRSGHVLSRSLLTLDVDHPPADFLEKLEEFTHGLGGVLYSTFSHRQGHERYRLVLPLARDCSAEEYEAVARRIAADIGIDIFDDTTFEPHRLMYWPGHPIDAPHVFRELVGPWVDPDKVLARYDAWQDMSTWPQSSRQTERLTKSVGSQADPLAKPGVIGAFCRTFDIDAAIARFLPDIYVAGSSADRYTYAAGESSNGVVVYDGKFAYSHHGTDPAGGQLCNAFDLVRIHKFGPEDAGAKPKTPVNRLESYKLMLDFAEDLAEVKLLAGKEQAQQAALAFAPADDDAQAAGQTKAKHWASDEDNEELALALERTESLAVRDTMNNHVSVLALSNGLKDLAYDQFSQKVAVRPGGRVPWKRVTDTWSDTDLAQLKAWMSKCWGIYSPGKTKDALAAVAATRPFHPVRDWLDSLPEWDKVERLDTLLVDYLGAENSDYVRAVTRKTLVAAVARVRRPGCKFDTILILNGPQGVGKSTIFAKLAGPWFSDSLTLTEMGKKDGAEKLQGNWILELGELAGMKKMEVETVKGFVSRTNDQYRPAYGTVVESHPRQCIIVGSTNAEDGFLRDITGNRRFWPVMVAGSGRLKSWEMSQDTIKQIWAEAQFRWEEKEPLHLTGEVAKIAAQAQSDALEEDDRAGMVERYLDTRLPESWPDMGLAERRQWLGGDTAAAAFGGREEGTRRRMEVSKAEIWAECFGKELGEMLPKDSYAIAGIVNQLGGWDRGKTREIQPIYGRQRVFRRDENPPF